MGLGRAVLAGRNSRVFSDALEVEDWVLEFGMKTISLTGVSFFISFFCTFVFRVLVADDFEIEL